MATRQAGGAHTARLTVSAATLACRLTPVTANPAGPRAGTGPAARFVAGLALAAAAGLFLLPFATVSRQFGGEGALLVLPGRVLDFTGFLPAQLPDFRVVGVVGWLLLAVLLALAFAALARPRLALPAGIAVIALAAVGIAVFVRAIDVVQLPLLTADPPTPFRRLPFRSFGPNLAPVLAVVAGIAGIMLALAQDPGPARRLARLRAVLVPAVAVLLSVAMGGLIILVLQRVPGAATGPQGLVGAWFGKIDLLWFSYATLFGPAFPTFRPAFDLAGPWQSLTLATPLMFTGLAVAFGFRAGLFNIGAPGQVIAGAILATAVGVYLPGPWWLVGPLGVMAAALGGGLWGAIPGWLKARFGSSEVINTIMLNYIASGIMIFLLGSDQATFFGRTIQMPFKAPGGEARSLELGEGGRLSSIVGLLGLQSGPNVVNLGPWLAAAGLALGLALWRGPLRRRLGPAAGFAVAGLLFGLVFLREVSIPVSGALASSRLNVSLLIAFAAAGFFAVLMWRTRYGYELRAVGLAPKAAEYGGISIARNVILAMTISGALAGLAGTHYVMGGALEEFRLKQSIPADTAGFAGITVALLGQNTPVGVLVGATLFGVLATGGLPLQQALQSISRDIVVVLQALIVLFIATGGFLSSRWTRPPTRPSGPPAGRPEASQPVSEPAPGGADAPAAGRSA